ncbi:hypothetical protein IJG27_00960 [Candidatus Saccharibacteria bacterium]|nr:hypothetical protein [Candidatus Saccharibacteria bacterium]
MAYSKSKNPRSRFLEYSSDEELFDDLLYSFPKKSHHEKITNTLAVVFPANRDYQRAAKTSILTVIVSVMLIITGFTIFCLIATPETLVKNEVTSIASDYYENYFYSKILDNNSLSQNSADFNESVMEDIMKNYTARGFANISLKQLLLYDNQKHASATAFLEQYCNLDRSYIKIYPEAPFNRKNYRVDYNYSCKF